MLSLGWNKTSKKWDNLNGHIIKIKDIKITY